MNNLRRTGMNLAMGTVAVWLLAGSHVAADNGKEKTFRARLNGGHETPAISTNATGEFKARLNAAGDELSYELTYSGLEGGDTLFAHVHLGQTGVAGGVMFFLCGGGGKPACPNGEGTVTGTVNAGNVIGPAGQGISAGQFDEVIRAMRHGLSYANVHTTAFPSGEIRGQINDNSAEQ
jgi:CHRD domain-containing protein